MANVTVLGAGGATVTIALTSQQNADAAQSATNVVNNLFKAGLVDMQITGAATLPAANNFLAGAVFTGSGFSGATGDQYLLIGANGKGETSALGGENYQTVVVAGNGSDLNYGNQSANGQVWLGKNSSNIANFKGNVTVNSEDGSYGLFSNAGTTNLFNLGAGGTVFVGEMNGVMGATTVNAASDTNVVMVGASTVPAMVNLTGSTGLVGLYDKASAVINPGSANSTVIGNIDGATGSATLFAGTGSTLVSDGIGVFNGGSAGGNVMFSSTVSGSATLIGGNGGQSAPTDVLVAQGSGQTLIAGIGNASLIAAAGDLGATGGSTFQVGAGFSTVFGYDLGGNIFSFFGFGASEIDGHNETAQGTQVGNLYFDTGVGSGSYVISDFVSGLDVFQVQGAYTLTFQAATDPNNTSGIERTTLQITNGATFTFFDAAANGIQDIFDADIQRLG